MSVAGNPILARWTSADGRGLEHLELRLEGGMIAADSLVIAEEEGRSFAIRYRIVCDPAWRVRSVEVDMAGRSGLRLSSTGGGWTNGAGTRLGSLDGAVDIDISATPFTNTLPIRRLALEPGRPQEIVVAYIHAPSLEVSRESQRYTRLESHRIYRFESLEGGFTRDIEVDAEGLVVDYPGLFRRTL